MRIAFFSLLGILLTGISLSLNASDNELRSNPAQQMIGLESETQFRVNDRGLEGITLNVTLPPVVQRLANQGNSNINFYDGNPAQAESTMPPTPVVSKWVVIPDRMNVESHVIEQLGSRVDYTTNTGIPHYVDDHERSIEDLEFETNDLIPAVVVGQPVVLRGIRMAPVSIRLLQHLPGTSLAFENRSITVDLQFTADLSDVQLHQRKPYSREFSRMLEAMVVNPPARDLAAEARAGIMIVHNEELEDEEDAMSDIRAFADWKQRLGYNTSIHPIHIAGEQEEMQESVRDQIQDLLDDEPTAEFLIIMGQFDGRDFGARYVDDIIDSPYFFPSWIDTVAGPEERRYPIISDNKYVTDEIFPDVIIGRFMCTDYDLLSYALQRSMRYEQTPAEGDWFTRALHSIPSNDDSLRTLPWRASEAGLWCVDHLRQIGFDEVETVWDEPFPIIGDPVDEILEEHGHSLFFGEAWAYGIVRYDTIQAVIQIVDTAIVEDKFPFIITNAEHYSQPVLVPFFNSGSQESDNGAVAAYGFWFDPYVAYTSEVIDWTVWGMQNLNEYTGGYLCAFSGLQVIPLVNIIEGVPEIAFQIMHTFRYLGDPTIQIRTEQPAAFTVNLPESFNTGSTLVPLTIMDEDNPVTAAMVCVRQNDLQYVAETDGAGQVFFTIPDGLEEGELQITVSKHNYLPLIEEVAVADQQINIVLEEAGFNEAQFANGSSVNLQMTLRNNGNSDARDLHAVFSTDNPYLSFNPAEIDIEAINAGGIADLNDVVEMSLNINCPGNSIIQVRTHLTSGEENWNVAFEFMSSGPDLEIVDAHPANLRREGNGTIMPEIANEGDLASTVLSAVLNSLTQGVTIGNDARNYAAINPDNSRQADNAFTVSIDRTFIPGRMARFELVLSGENDFEKVIPFSVGPIGEASPEDPLGPDNYGYVCFNNDDEGWRDSPVYNWYEINPDADENEFGGTKLFFAEETLAQDDFWDISGLVALPFDFQYYGEVFDSIVVCTNGWISLGTENIDRITPAGQIIPGIATPSGMICPYWIDLKIVNIEYTGIYTYYIEEEGLFIVEWSGVEVRSHGFQNLLMFQVVFFDPELYQTESGDGEIRMQYKQYFEILGPQYIHYFPVIGISSPDGNDGILYSLRNNVEAVNPPIAASALHDESVLKFTTDIEFQSGTVFGRVVRADNPDTGVPGAVVNPARMEPLVTDDQGRFRIEEKRAGRYRVVIEAEGLNRLVTDFNIIANAETELDPFPMTFGLPFIEDDRLEFSLRPDGSRTRADIKLENHGNGPLEYTIDVRYADGNPTDYAVLDSVRLGDAIGDNVLGDIIRAYSTIYVDSLFYIPFWARQANEYYIASLNRNGERVNLINQPVDSGNLRFLTHDGELFWGCHSNANGESELIGFDLDGNISHQYVIPINLNSGIPLVYSSERNTFFLTDYNQDIFEINRDGEVRNHWPINFPGRDVEISGLGWNSLDSDGMQLYLVDDYLMREENRFRYLKMNPDNGEWIEVAFLDDGRPASTEGYGISVINNYDNTNSAFAMIETLGGRQQANDYLVVRKLAPNLTMIVPNSYANMSGEIPADEYVNAGFQVEVPGWDEGFYYWSYYIEHSGTGNPLLVVVEMEVDDMSGLEDPNAGLPVTFGLNSIYPNPFNNVTRINFSVDRLARTQIHAYDVNGRLIQAMYDETPDVGNHIVSWDASGLASGVYIVRLESEGMTATRKIVLMK